GDRQGQHAGGVVGGDAVGVQGFAEEDLPGEGAVGSFGDDHLGAVGLRCGSAFGADGEHVLLDGQVDGSWIDAGQVEVNVEAVAPAIRVHGHRGGPRGSTEYLLGEPVQ